MEVKAPQEELDRVRRVLSALPVSLARNSKYVHGCHAQTLLG